MDPEVIETEIPQNGLQPAPEASDPPPQAQPDPAGDPAPEPSADPAQHGNKGKQPWFLNRISQESESRRQAEERAAAAERRAAEAEALLARGVGGNQPPAPAAPAAPNASAPDFQTAVRQEAARIKLAEDSTAIRDKGLQKHGTAFNEALGVLNAVGATSDDVVQDLIAAARDNADDIIIELAKDPERAASLAGMDSRRRIAELTRMSMSNAAPAAAPAPKPAAQTTPAARQVSRAPAPPPSVEPSASKVIDGYSDEASDEQFTAQFNERMKARAARR